MHRVSAPTLLSRALVAALANLGAIASVHSVEATAPLSGAVAGTVSINDKTAPLRYVYAQRHASHGIDLKRLGKSENSGEDAPVLSVVAVTRRLSETEWRSLLDGSYAGAKDLAGVLLTADAKDWAGVAITDKMLAGSYGFTSSGGDTPAAVGDRAQGLVIWSNQSAEGSYRFGLGFDAPLASLQGDARCDAATIKTFHRTLPGRWRLDSLAGTTDTRTSGKLVVADDLGGDSYRATLHIGASQEHPAVDEEATLTCVNGKIVLNGAIAPNIPWLADTFTLTLDGRKLSGTGDDRKGNHSTIALRKE
jgi:hypothetical protein